MDGLMAIRREKNKEYREKIDDKQSNRGKEGDRWNRCTVSLKGDGIKVEAEILDFFDF